MGAVANLAPEQFRAIRRLACRSSTPLTTILDPSCRSR